MEEKKKLSNARIQSMIMIDLVFRSPLWALLILVIYGIIMSGAMWFLMYVIKPSIDKKMQRKHKSEQTGSYYREAVNMNSSYEFGRGTGRRA